MRASKNLRKDSKSANQNLTDPFQMAKMREPVVPSVTSKQIPSNILIFFSNPKKTPLRIATWTEHGSVFPRMFLIIENNRWAHEKLRGMVIVM